MHAEEKDASQTSVATSVDNGSQKPMVVPGRLDVESLQTQMPPLLTGILQQPNNNQSASSSSSRSKNTLKQAIYHNLQSINILLGYLEANNGNQTTAMVRVKVPGRLDFLFGTGRPIQSHPGNDRFRQLIHDCKEKYDSSRYARKKEMTEEMVDRIRSSGRFLKINGDGWVEVIFKEARRKVSHTFRGAKKTKTFKEKQKQEEERRSSTDPNPPPLAWSNSSGLE